MGGKAAGMARQDRWDSARLGLTLATMGPLLYLQGQQVRRTVPQGSDCFHPEGQLEGAGPALRLAFVGDSIMAGIGHSDPDETLPSQIATQLQAKTGRAVSWQNWAYNGACSQKLLEVVPESLPEVDLVLVSVGVNDAIQLRSPVAYVANLVELARRRPDVPWLLVGLPDLRDFPCFPFPLRSFLAWRVSQLESVAQQLDGPWSAYLLRTRHTLDTFCPDRFHPGPVGCRSWARMMLPTVMERLGVRQRMIYLPVVG